MRDFERGPGEVKRNPIQLSQFFPFCEVGGDKLPALAMESAKFFVGSVKSNLNDQTEVQLSAAIRRMKDSVDHYQGGH